MDLVALSLEDYRALVARFAEHGNSHRRMMGALREAGADAGLERLRALRRMERRFDVDLGALCWRVEHRNDPATHPIERWVLDYVTRRGAGDLALTEPGRDPTAANSARGGEPRGTQPPGDRRREGPPPTGGPAVPDPAGAAHLWVLLDRLREVRAWIHEGRMVPESEG